MQPANVSYSEENVIHPVFSNRAKAIAKGNQERKQSAKRSRKNLDRIMKSIKTGGGNDVA
jgi:hypothetical protein